MISKRMQFQNPIEKSQLKLTTATVRPEPDQLENTLKAPLHSSDANLHQVRSEEDGSGRRNDDAIDAFTSREVGRTTKGIISAKLHASYRCWSRLEDFSDGGRTKFQCLTNAANYTWHLWHCSNFTNIRHSNSCFENMEHDDPFAT